jgi:aspartate kinase
MSPNSLPNGLCSVSQPNGFIDTPGEKWLVQKFGGTSVGKFPLNIVDNVVRRVIFIALCYQSSALTFSRPSLSHGRVAVVCSARSSSSKADGTTNR